MLRSPAIPGHRAAPRRSRRYAALLPLLLLVTCGPAADSRTGVTGFVPPQAVAVARGPARFLDHEFIAADGARLPLRKWLPQGAVKAVILALHGFGDYSHGFAMPAEIWASRGIATFAYDQRGFGRAPGRGLWAGDAQLAVDAIVASRILRATYPGRPQYLLGESMGGAVAILAATGAVPGMGEAAPVADIDGVILSAPAVWGRATMDLVPKLLLFAGVRLFPDWVLSGSGLRILASDNLPMLRALARDPLVLKGARIATIYGLVNLMDDAFAAAPHLGLPTLLMYGAHDQVVPRRPIEEFAEHLPPDPDHRRRLAYYPAGYHLLLRDLEAPIVDDDVAAWILDHGMPLPSHADVAEDAAPWPPRSTAAAAPPMPLARAGTRR